MAGGGCGTLILSYINRFCPFLEIENFELHFLLGGGGGGGAGDQKNKYVWRYDEIMIYFLYVLGGVMSINLGLFKVNVQI